MSLRLIITLLPQLTSEELDQLSNRIKVLQSVTSKKSTNPHLLATHQGSELNELILKAAATIAERHGADLGAIFLLRSAAKTTSFRSKQELLTKWLQKITRIREQQYALLLKGFDLLLRDMLDRRYVVTARTLLAHMHRIPAMLNRAYPGYAASGLLHWVVKDH